MKYFSLTLVFAVLVAFIASSVFSMPDDGFMHFRFARRSPQEGEVTGQKRGGNSGFYTTRFGKRSSSMANENDSKNVVTGYDDLGVKTVCVSTGIRKIFVCEKMEPWSTVAEQKSISS